MLAERPCCISYSMECARHLTLGKLMHLFVIELENSAVEFCSVYCSNTWVQDGAPGEDGYTHFTCKEKQDFWSECDRIFFRDRKCEHFEDGPIRSERVVAWETLVGQ